MDKFTLFLQLSQTNHFENSTNINCQSKPITKTARQPRSSPASCPLTPIPFTIYPSLARPTHPLPSLLLRHLQNFIITFLTIPSKMTVLYPQHPSPPFLHLARHWPVPPDEGAIYSVFDHLQRSPGGVTLLLSEERPYLGRMSSVDFLDLQIGNSIEYIIFRSHIFSFSAMSSSLSSCSSSHWWAGHQVN